MMFNSMFDELKKVKKEKKQQISRVLYCKQEKR